MSLKDKEKWNSKYEEKACLEGRDACPWLTENALYLSGKGKALDLAMGEGRNAIFAASLGYDVLGVDISEVGIRKAESLAKEEGVTLSTEVVDLDDYTFPEEAFDLILCFYFLDRKLFRSIDHALKPGGVVVCETFNVDYLKYSGFRREWALEPNELLDAFASFHILHYREMDDPKEEKAVSSLVAQKPEDH